MMRVADEQLPTDYLRPLIDTQKGGTIFSLNYDNALETAGGDLFVTHSGARTVQLGR